MRQWQPKEINFLHQGMAQKLSGIEIAHRLWDAGIFRSASAVRHKLATLGWEDPREGNGKEDSKAFKLKSRTAYLDIESTGLTADFDMILCWSLYDKQEKKVYHDCMTQAEHRDKNKEDRRILKSLAEILISGKYRRVVVFYGGDFRFDIPMIRTRCVGFNIPFPEYDAFKVYDLYKPMKQKFRFKSGSLARACEFFRIKGKKPLPLYVWRDAQIHGDPDALKLLQERCDFDTTILAKLEDRVLKYLHGNPSPL